MTMNKTSQKLALVLAVALTLGTASASFAAQPRYQGGYDGSGAGPSPLSGYDPSAATQR